MSVCCLPKNTTAPSCGIVNVAATGRRFQSLAAQLEDRCEMIMFGSMPAGMLQTERLCTTCFLAVFVLSLSLSPSVSRSVSPCPIIARILRLLLQQMWKGKGSKPPGMEVGSRPLHGSSPRILQGDQAFALRKTMRERDNAITWQLEKGLLWVSKRQHAASCLSF